MHLAKAVSNILLLASVVRSSAIPNSVELHGSPGSTSEGDSETGSNLQAETGFNYTNVADIPTEYYKQLTYNDDLSAQGIIENWYANNPGKWAMFTYYSTVIRGVWGASGIESCTMNNASTWKRLTHCLSIIFFQEKCVAFLGLLLWAIDFPDVEDPTVTDVVVHNYRLAVKNIKRGAAFTQRVAHKAHVEYVSLRLDAECTFYGECGGSNSTDLEIIALRDEDGVHLNVLLDHSVSSEEFEKMVLDAVPGVPVNLINEDGTVSNSKNGDHHEAKYISYNVNTAIANNLLQLVRASDYNPFPQLLVSNKDEPGVKERLYNRAKSLFTNSGGSSCYAGSGDAGTAESPQPFGVVGQTYFNTYGPANEISCYNLDNIKKALV